MPPMKPPMMPAMSGAEDDPMAQLNDLYGMGAAPVSTPSPDDPGYDGDGLDSEATGDWDPGMQHAAMTPDEPGDFDPAMGGMGMNDMSPANDIGLEGLFDNEPPMYGSPPIPALPEEEQMGMSKLPSMGRPGGSVPPSKFLKSGYGVA